MLSERRKTPDCLVCGSIYKKSLNYANLQKLLLPRMGCDGRGWGVTVMVTVFHFRPTKLF